MIETRTAIRVRYAETDTMGFAHHANYLVWFEMARIELMDRLGLPYREIESSGYYMPVLEAQARYFRSLRFDDRVVIILRIKEPPRAKFRVDYTVERDGERVATGYSRHAFIEKSGRPVRPPRSFVEAIERGFSAPAQVPIPPEGGS